LGHPLSLRKIEHFLEDIDADDIRIRQFLLQG